MAETSETLLLRAPVSGVLLPLAAVPDPDPVFADGMFGDGLAIDPLSDTLVTPCDGTIVHLAATGHALTLLSGVYYATLNQSGGHGTLVTLGAKYDFSKRTSLYGTVASVFNSRNATFSVEASPDTMPGAGANQQGAYAGIIHLF
ncbi:PTS glucose transporter subunit IIA [Cupriavidus necator]|uniref:PTS sugar transporter subunit IIA n=1 Tax=Cupriavidus necator TaxID=106590 RepID=UPI003ECE7EBE